MEFLAALFGVLEQSSPLGSPLLAALAPNDEAQFEGLGSFAVLVNPNFDLASFLF